MRPRYKQYRKTHPEVGRVAAFVYVNPLYIFCRSCRGSLPVAPVTSFAGRSLGHSRSRIVSGIARRFSKKTSSETLEVSRSVHNDAILDYNSQEEGDSEPQEFEVETGVEGRRATLTKSSKESIEEALAHFGI